MAMQMKSENGTERVISDLNVNVSTAANNTTSSKKRSGDEFKGLFSETLDIIDLFPNQQFRRFHSR